MGKEVYKAGVDGMNELEDLGKEAGDALKDPKS